MKQKLTSTTRLLIAFLDEAVYQPMKPVLILGAIFLGIGVMYYLREFIAKLFLGALMLGFVAAVIWSLRKWYRHVRDSWRRAKERVEE